MISDRKINFYIASCVPDGGVYSCDLSEDGSVDFVYDC